MKIDNDYEAWNDSIASLFPLSLSGDVVALRACVDAGEQSGVYAIAGIAYGFDRAVKANAKWESVLKGRTFHMTDLHARQGAFKGISDAEVAEIMQDTVAAINSNASYAMCVSCDMSEVSGFLSTLAPDTVDIKNIVAAFRSPYGFLCHFLMMALGNRATGHHGGNGRHISYVFEQGDQGQSGLRHYLDYLGSAAHHKLFLDGYSFNRMTITPKNELEAVFHSSDLLAWEWARHVDRQRKNLPMRKSLSALVGGASVESDKFGLTLSDGKRFFCRHFDAARMAAITEYFSSSLGATNEKELLNAFVRYREACPLSG